MAALAAVAATASVAAWGFFLLPERWSRWLVAATLLPAMWALAEAGQERGRDPSVGRPIMILIRSCFAWAGLMLTAQLGLRLAIHAGLVSQAWLPAGRRAVGLLLALGMVLFGNALPTLRSPWPYPDQPFAWQQVHRFVGWTFVIGGLVVGGCWTLLPPGDASRAAAAIMIVVVALSFGRKLTSVATHAGRSLAG